MERMLTKKTTATGCTMEVTVMKIGEDFQICLAGGEKLGIPFERKSLENRCRSRRIEREEHHHEKRRVDKQEHKRGKNLTEKLHHTTSLSASSEAKRFIIAMLISIITISTSDIDAPRL